MAAIYIDKHRYEIEEQKEVPVWCTGIYRPISSTDYIRGLLYAEDIKNRKIAVLCSKYSSNILLQILLLQ
jgi:hypothetical protein